MQNWRDKHPQKIIFIRMFKKKNSENAVGLMWIGMENCEAATQKNIYINENKKL